MFKIIGLIFSLLLVQQVVAEGELTLIKFRELFDKHIEEYSFNSTESIVKETLRLQERDPTKLTQPEADDLSNLVEACNIIADYCTPNLENEYVELMAKYKEFPAIISYMSECELRQKNFCKLKHIANPNWPNEGPDDWKEDHYIVYATEGEPIGHKKTLEKMKKLLELYKDRTDEGSNWRREKIDKLVKLSQLDPVNCEPKLAYERRDLFRYNSAYTVNLVPYMNYWLDAQNERCNQLLFVEEDLEAIGTLDKELKSVTDTDKKAARKKNVKTIFAYLLWKAKAELDPGLTYKSILKKHSREDDDDDDEEEAESKKHKKCAAPKFEDFKNFVEFCKRKLEMTKEFVFENGSNSPDKLFIGVKTCSAVLEDLEAISKDVYDAVQMRKVYCRFNPRLRYRYGKFHLSKYFKSNFSGKYKGL